jgi:hypothetical protein
MIQQNLIEFQRGISKSNPLYDLITKASTVPFDIAPEMIDKLRKYLGDDIITVTCIEKDYFMCEGSKASKFIVISDYVFAAVWIASYCNGVFYKEIVDTGRLNYGGVTEIEATETAGKALALMEWFTKEVENNRWDKGWPSNLPIPGSNPEQGSVNEFVDKVALNAIAFFIYHELGHVFCDEEVNENDLDAERKADDFATHWILKSKSKIDASEYAMRLLGVAVATLVLASNNIRNGSLNEISHPNGFQRMKSILKEYIPNMGHTVWHVIAVSLTIHMHFANIDVRGVCIDKNRPGDIVEEYIGLLGD